MTSRGVESVNDGAHGEIKDDKKVDFFASQFQKLRVHQKGRQRETNEEVR